MSEYFTGSIGASGFVHGLGAVPFHANVKTLLGALRWFRPRKADGKCVPGKFVHRDEQYLQLQLEDGRTVTVRRRFT